MGNKYVRKVRSLIGETARYLPRNYSYIRLYNAHYKRKEKENHIVFIVQNPDVWSSSSTVYDALKHMDGVKITFVALPPYKDWRMRPELVDSTIAFCQSICRNTISAFDETTSSYVSLKSLNPSRIFIDKPYSDGYPKEYTIENLARIAPVCHIPYGYSTQEGEMQKVVWNESFLRNVSFLFADGPCSYRYCKSKVALSELFTKRRIYNVGFPRFDLYAGVSKKERNKKCILWLPRWTSPTQESTGNEPSSFLEYKDRILDYAEDHPECDFILRPHPLTFTNYVSSGIMTNEDVDQYKDRIEKIPNVTLDRSSSYIEALIEADILVADFTSLLVEFFVLGKPIIYLGRTSQYSRENMAMCNSWYHSKSWLETEHILTELLQGIDAKNEDRRKIINDYYLPEDTSIGKRIAEILTQE